MPKYFLNFEKIINYSPLTSKHCGKKFCFIDLNIKHTSTFNVTCILNKLLNLPDKNKGSVKCLYRHFRDTVLWVSDSHTQHLPSIMYSSSSQHKFPTKYCWIKVKGPLLTLREKIPFNPYSGFTPVFTHYTSAKQRYSPNEC